MIRFVSVFQSGFEKRFDSNICPEQKEGGGKFNEVNDLAPELFMSYSPPLTRDELEKLSKTVEGRFEPAPQKDQIPAIFLLMVRPASCSFSSNRTVVVWFVSQPPIPPQHNEIAHSWLFWRCPAPFEPQVRLSNKTTVQHGFVFRPSKCSIQTNKQKTLSFQNEHMLLWSSTQALSFSKPVRRGRRLSETASVRKTKLRFVSFWSWTVRVIMTQPRFCCVVQFVWV